MVDENDTANNPSASAEPAHVETPPDPGAPQPETPQAVAPPEPAPPVPGVQPITQPAATPGMLQSLAHVLTDTDHEFGAGMKEIQQNLRTLLGRAGILHDK